MYSQLYNNVKYLANIDYMISVYIREYDISKANINILKEVGILSDEQYTYYYNLEKMQREIQIGYLLRNNPKYVDILRDGLTEARRLFFEVNDIKDEEVLSIKNDAIYLINKIPVYTKFGSNIEFIHKNTYTSYYKLSNKEYYYYLDTVNEIEKLDIKGINTEILSLHKDYFLDFLLTIFYNAQSYPIADTLDLLKGFYMNYINLKLDIGYYRRFDGESCYDIKSMSKYSQFKAMQLASGNITSVDISYNLNILSQLVKIYSGIYFKNNI